MKMKMKMNEVPSETNVDERRKPVGNTNNYKLQVGAVARRTCKDGKVTYEAEVVLPSTMDVTADEAKELGLLVMKAGEQAYQMMEELQKEYELRG